MEDKNDDIEAQKEKIRIKYKGIDPRRINIIQPETSNKNTPEIPKILRVAVYARVSTDDIHQTTSYELQRNHYMDLINNNPNWTLVDIYADEGISGTSLNHREAFMRMINDCREGKIDLIITKTVARFARNTLDCLAYVRELKNRPQPVGIYFETEGIKTLESNSEVILTILATLAQDESRNKSDIMNASIDMRFQRGIFLTSSLLGYDITEDGNYVINNREAQIIKLIYYMYLSGSTCQQIADTLTEYNFKTKKGNDTWSSSSIMYILQNERYCGDLIARKTWTPNFLDHKSKKNINGRKKYQVFDHHEKIISRDNYLAVQRIISNAKYGNRGFLPELKVISGGVLNGFVCIHPTWGSFNIKDYIAASRSVDQNEDKNLNVSEVILRNGEFDLRKYEVVRLPFINCAQKFSVFISKNSIKFSSECIRKFKKFFYVEIFVHPQKKLMLIKPCNKDSKFAIEWGKLCGNKLYSKPISCQAYIKTLFDIFNWNIEYKYKVIGTKGRNTNENIMIFNMSEAEMFIPSSELEATKPEDGYMVLYSLNKNMVAYPKKWRSNFGNNFYVQEYANESGILKYDCNSNLLNLTTYQTEKQLVVTDREELMNNIIAIKQNCSDGEMEYGK